MTSVLESPNFDAFEEAKEYFRSNLSACDSIVSCLSGSMEDSQARTLFCHYLSEDDPFGELHNYLVYTGGMVHKSLMPGMFQLIHEIVPETVAAEIRKYRDQIYPMRDQALIHILTPEGVEKIQSASGSTVSNMTEFLFAIYGIFSDDETQIDKVLAGITKQMTDYLFEPARKQPLLDQFRGLHQSLVRLGRYFDF